MGNRLPASNFINKMYGGYAGVVVLLIAAQSLEAGVLTFYSALFQITHEEDHVAWVETEDAKLDAKGGPHEH